MWQYIWDKSSHVSIHPFSAAYPDSPLPPAHLGRLEALLSQKKISVLSSRMVTSCSVSVYTGSPDVLVLHVECPCGHSM